MVEFATTVILNLKSNIYCIQKTILREIRRNIFRFNTFDDHYCLVK